jgi:DNA-binding IclR family transcriptional regulator
LGIVFHHHEKYDAFMSGPVRSLSQGFTILRLLAVREALTLSDICRETGLSPSSGLNLLRTLVAEGAVDRDTGGKRYRLAAGWGDLGVLQANAVSRFAARVRPLLARFAAAHDATAGLWQVQAGERLSLIALGESGAETRIHMVEGQRQPLGGGAAGRALAAAEALGRDDLAARFARVRWRTRWASPPGWVRSPKRSSAAMRWTTATFTPASVRWASSCPLRRCGSAFRQRSSPDRATRPRSTSWGGRSVRWRVGPS